MNMEAIQIKQVTQHECHNNESRRVLFGKYEMGRLLGQGTFAKVYKCKNIATQENVAIKVIQKEHVRKQGLMEQLKIEISVMHLVKHPNIVELKEVMATKSKVFFVMEFVKGGELFAKVQRGKLKEDVARKYFQQLISAVDYCHSRGVSHRDLKPENLLLDEKEDLKVSDFGLSALPEQHLTDGLLHTACGTPAYIAPEVLRQKGYDGAKADIWSCGVILFVLLSGYLPFQNANLMKMYMKIFKADYECPPWISPHTKSLISKLLVVDPEERITISQIMQTPWLQKGRMETHHLCRDNNLKGEESAGTEHLPRFYNAFEFISSMSPALDLSSLFESKRKCPSMFTSKCPAPLIVGKLKTAAKELNLEVLSNRDCKVEMQGKVDGRKGKLAVTAEVFEVAPQVAVVEFSKCSGDTLEYTKFCEESIRPAIKDIVWIWQGERM